MIKKFIYKVHKNFALSEDGFKELSIITNKPEEAKGSYFAVGDAYVDYEADERNVEITKITKKLLDGKFLTLESQVEM